MIYKLSVILLLGIGNAIELPAQPGEKLLIAAASDLKFALDSILTIYELLYPDAEVKVTYGSSGKLFEQISNGAPFDIFFSADIEYPKKLKQNGLTGSDVRSYGTGRIVIWSKKLDPSAAGMNTLQNSSIAKVAIANPLHAPYGKRADEALRYYGLLPSIKQKLVFGENISQTAQFVTTGAADAGIIALSLALSPAMRREKGSYYLIPEKSHQPLKQGFVILKRAQQNDLARYFGDFIVSSKGSDILSYFGFKQ